MNSSEPPLQFKIHGMDCAEEVATLKREVGPVVGGEDRLVFDILNGKMNIQPPASEVTPDAIIRAVSQTGMRAELWRDATRTESDGRFWQHQERNITTALSGLLVFVGFAVHVVLAGGIWEAIGSEGVGVGCAKRYDDYVVLVKTVRINALGLRHTDNLKRHSPSPDADGLADGVRRTKQVCSHGRAEHC
jgi:hypothetical protein